MEILLLMGVGGRKQVNSQFIIMLLFFGFKFCAELISMNECLVGGVDFVLKTINNFCP